MMMTQNNQVEWGKKWEEEEGWRRAEEPGGADAESGFIDCSSNNLYHLICLVPCFDCDNIVFMTKESKLDYRKFFLLNTNLFSDRGA